jgi:hypothetical protein
MPMKAFITPFNNRTFLLGILAVLVIITAYVPFSFAQFDLSISGNTEVTGDLSLTGAGKGIVFPDASKQTSAGQKRYVSTVVISPAATEAESGTALRNAIEAIVDATETTPYLVKIEPGIYDIGTSALQMKPYVDVEGSGETVTKILGTVAGSDPTTGVVVTADQMELRFLTVENDSRGAHVIAIYNGTGSPKLIHVTALIRAPLVMLSEEFIKNKAPAGPTSYVYGIYNNAVSAELRNVTVDVAGTNYAYGVYNKDSGNNLTMNLVNMRVIFASYCYGIFNYNSSPTITGTSSVASTGTNCYSIFNSSSSAPFLFNVIARGGGDCTNSYGIYNNNSGPVLVNVVADATGGTSLSRGMHNTGSTNTIKADRCSFIGKNYSIYNDADFTLYLGASKLDGTANTGTGTWKCANCYDKNYGALSSGCAD